MLSVAIVCRNNEATIGRTLSSVDGLADEIVAVDSGSTDGTIGLLQRAGAKVFQTEWRGYVATKQAALEACTQELVLSLDSDESLDSTLVSAMRALLAVQKEHGETGARLVDGWMMNRKVYYRGRALNHAWQPERRLRLVRRGRAKWTGHDPHDRLELQSGAVVEGECLEGFIRHDSIGTFADFFRKQMDHSRLMASSLHASGERGKVSRLVVSPAGAFLKQIAIKQAWRDGWPGWLAAASSAAGALAKHAMLIEMSRGEDDKSQSANGKAQG
jgi:glycosyltransferase involved in cell wall biosynthesis